MGGEGAVSGRVVLPGSVFLSSIILYVFRCTLDEIVKRLFWCYECGVLIDVRSVVLLCACIFCTADVVFVVWLSMYLVILFLPGHHHHPSSPLVARRLLFDFFPGRSSRPNRALQSPMDRICSIALDRSVEA